MPVTVVVGGQFGSEGKGKVAHFFAKQQEAQVAVRCGGSNSGHTVIDENGNAIIFQQLPTAAVLPDVKLVLCAGSYIDIDILFAELKKAHVSPERLLIDEQAIIITSEMKEREQAGELIEKIGSTGSGTGAAVAARVNREDSVVLAKDEPRLFPFIGDAAQFLREELDKDARIILEGTQGFGLSPLHSGLFPKVTSRDTTAAGFISEAGVSLFDVDDVVLVIRAFPIRVAGDSGPLQNEMTWEQVTKEGGFTELLQERTSVTKKVRRVARFDAEIVKRAIMINRPTKIILNHVDYISGCGIAEKRGEFVQMVENQLNVSVDYVGLSASALVERS